MSKSQRPAKANFSSITRSFVGYLIGTQKAAHTVANYKSDLALFEAFLLTQNRHQPTVRVDALSQRDFEQYAEYLKAQGFKTNTRRRKLLTIRKLFRYLKSRKRVSIDIAARVATPMKSERLPRVLPYVELYERIMAMPSASVIERRDRLLLWFLLETGCLASECGRLRTDGLGAESSAGGTGAVVRIDGKNARTVPISPELLEALQAFVRDTRPRGGAVFSGFNKFGSLGGAITSRGVELVVERFARGARLEKLTPRTLRHSRVLEWMRQGADSSTIQQRLGLKSQYAFRIYSVLKERIYS